MVDRDPDTIKREIDQAREQLASTVDTLAERADPSRLADDAKAAALRFAKKPAVVGAVVGAVVLALIVRRVRRR